MENSMVTMGDGKKKDDCVKLAEYHFVDIFLKKSNDRYFLFFYDTSWKRFQTYPIQY
jgi:hypothetical protein